MVKRITLAAAILLTVAVALLLFIPTREVRDETKLLRLSDREMKAIVGKQGENLTYCHPISDCWGYNSSCPKTVPSGAKQGDNCGATTTYYSLNECNTTITDPDPQCTGTLSEWNAVCTRTYDCTVVLYKGELQCLKSGDPTDVRKDFTASPDCWTASP